MREPNLSPLLVLGACHWDVIARAAPTHGPGNDVPGTIVRRAGGVAFNVAAHLARLGHPVTLATVITTDAPGNALLNTIRAEGIDTSLVACVPARESDGYVAIEDASGELVSAVASVNVLASHAAALAKRALTAAEHAAAVVVDTNLTADAISQVVAFGRPIFGVPANAATAPRLHALLAGSGRVIANLREATALTADPPHDAHAAAAALAALGVSAALITDGPHPATLAADGTLFTATPAPVGVRSVTGAGDALAAAYISSVIAGHHPQSALDRALGAARHHVSACG